MPPVPYRTPCYCNALRRATRTVTSVYDQALSPAALTLPQFAVLRQIKRAGSVSVTRLAEVAGLERTTMGRNLQPLLSRELISLLRSETDARERLVTLTPAGEQAIERALPLWRKAQQEIESRLGRDKLLLLSELLGQLEATPA